MKTVVIIPARYESTRLPGKPILQRVKQVTGKYLIEHCHDRAMQAPSVSRVIVATDDDRIRSVVEDFGGEARMTDPDHKCGTDRVAEVARSIDADIVVNIQGDEPDIDPRQIEQAIQLLVDNPNSVMGTLAHPIEDVTTWEDPNAVKVVVDNSGAALYFSRSPIPFVRDAEDWITETPCKPLHHMGIYSFDRKFLLQYASMPPCPLEKAEKLEQLRALNAGFKIEVGITSLPSTGIDTPENLEDWLAGYR